MKQATSKIKNKARDAGFTIIEVMIAMTIFLVLVTVGIGAVLDATAEHSRTQNIRTITDNLNFVMEDVARNIRLGSEMRCVTPATDVPYPGYIDPASTTNDIIPLSCLGGSNKLIFKSQNGTNLTYVVSPSAQAVIKIAGDTGSPTTVTPPEVIVDPLLSGFTVRGAEAGDLQQPSVTFRLAGTITYKGIASPFSLETTVVPRSLDS